MVQPDAALVVGDRRLLGRSAALLAPAGSSSTSTSTRDGRRARRRLAAAHDFVWRHRRAPYDLVVYQLGNASCHDYMWGYLFRYPGWSCCTTGRCTRRGPRICSPAGSHGATTTWPSSPPTIRTRPPDLGALVAEGLGGTLFGHWPLVRLLLQASRLTAVHSAVLAAPAAAGARGARSPRSRWASPIRWHAGPVTAAEVRARYGLGADNWSSAPSAG